MPEDIRIHCKELKEKIWNDPYMKEVYVKAPRAYWPHREPTDNADWFRYFYDHNIVERLLSPEYDLTCFYYVHEDAHLHHMETNNRDYNHSIVHHTATCGDVEIKCVQVLIEFGADVHVENYYKDTPLHYAAENGKEECVALLLENGASVTSKNLDDKTPICIARRENHDHILKLLKDVFL
ncbi:uncharacterized protein LOC133825763 [Humulus lupulus]|uniref:uncharacterized protein LOC133825763 n=1 Tax=Humulus lupulus TaxID=3486 RepID=UPI002B40CDC9|nr:uncharacterized protein LOC133825763 [Humulus lupulus]